MREIKFKCYIKDPGSSGLNVGYFTENNRTYNVDKIDFENKNLMIRAPSEIYLSFDEVVLRPYIDYLDKNKKEIYDGDIVKNEDDFGVIVWFEDLAGFVVNWPETGLQLLNEVEVEVIGNIYENRELLNG